MNRKTFYEFGPATSFDAAEIVLPSGAIIAWVAEPRSRRSDGGSQWVGWDEDRFRKAVQAWATSTFVDPSNSDQQVISVLYDPGRDQATEVILKD